MSQQILDLLIKTPFYFRLIGGYSFTMDCNREKLPPFFFFVCARTHTHTHKAPINEINHLQNCFMGEEEPRAHVACCKIILLSYEFNHAHIVVEEDWSPL